MPAIALMLASTNEAGIPARSLLHRRRGPDVNQDLLIGPFVRRALAGAPLPPTITYATQAGVEAPEASAPESVATTSGGAPKPRVRRRGQRAPSTSTGRVDVSLRLRQYPGMGLSRKLRRASERKAALRREVDSYGLEERLAMVAGNSLCFTDQQITDAMNVLFNDASENQQLGDILQARMLELFELVRGAKDDDEERLRADLEARNGASFLVRVAGMGNSASSAAEQFAGLLASDGSAS